MAISSPNTSTTSTAPGSGQSYGAPLAVVTTLFFMWGFLTCLNDILVPHLKSIFDLNYTAVQADSVRILRSLLRFLHSLRQDSLTGSAISDRWWSGLLTMGVGAFLFVPAASVPSYPLFLGALIVLAAGITCLQVAANPYVTVLGKPETASSRLNLDSGVQLAGNLLGAFLRWPADPQRGSEDHGARYTQWHRMHLQAYRLHEAATRQDALCRPRHCLGGACDRDWQFQVADDRTRSAQGRREGQRLDLAPPEFDFRCDRNICVCWRRSFHRELLGELFRPARDWWPAEKLGASFVSFYWGGAMLGRFIGSNYLGGAKAKYMALVSAVSIALILLSYPIEHSMPPGYQPGVPNLTWLAWLVVAGRPLFVLVAIAALAIAVTAALRGGKATANTGVLLAICAVCTSLLAAISMLNNGHIAMWSIILVGFFNSIMFPSIFTLGVAELGPLTGDGSGIMIMAIVGGAIIPVAQGAIADRIGIHHAFFLPVICYLYILYFALSGSKPNSQRYAKA